MTAKKQAQTQKRKRGRPSGFTQALADRICTRIMEGQSLRTICKAQGMPALSSVFKWLNENPAFSDQYARAREVQADLLADDTVDIADTEQDPQKARVRIDARKWKAGQMSGKWSSRTVTEHRGAVGTYDASRLKDATDEELAVLEKLFGRLSGDDPESDTAGEGAQAG